ncbi:TPA: MerR family transcriptional regulator [Streptococcus suis]|nr:MerR family transcriptional regulator [Streptococcus suis]NQM33482.1 MerR family transcriptional regulator [Streptococcus suis]HEL1985712.1 MerR family transcriptional regulator [Streptococcus suis]HEL2376568.1 MerR family transcriptional regulator [Streptococcus suis]HEL2412429.1 MerR family transcriptional regulator [Streptococcus suis]
MDRNYTIKEIMTITGLTKRTLHYYDRVGLLPAEKLENGYRSYCQKALIRLQKILFLKALDFSIKDIQNLIDLTDEDLRPILEKQEKVFALKIKELQEKERQLQAFLSGQPLLDLDIFERPLSDQYKAEAEMRYGDTPAYQIFQERQEKLDTDQKGAEQERLEQIFQLFSQQTHLPYDAPEVKQLVEEWRRALLAFSDFSDQVLVYIAQTYEDDPRFKQYFQKYGNPDLPAFIKKAVEVHLGL